MSRKNRHRRQEERRELAQQPNPPQQEQIKVGIPPPPDYIFEFRKNRIAPAQDVWGAQGTISYIPQEAKYIEGEGNFVYHYKVPFPSKTVAPVEAIHAMAGAKRLTINAIKFLSTIRPWHIFTANGRGKILTNALDYFNDTAGMMMVGWYLEDGYYCSLAKEVRKAVEAFLIEFRVEESVAKRTSKIIASFFEYDNAYRTRIQDLAGETKQHALLANLPEELYRLTQIQATREMVPNGGQEVVKRFNSAVRIIRWLWWFPKTRKAIKEAIKAVDLEKMKMDEADIYHTLLYGDYNTMGRTLEERIKVLESYHGVDQANWPPRILVKPAPVVPPNE